MSCRESLHHTLAERYSITHSRTYRHTHTRTQSHTQTNTHIKWHAQGFPMQCHHHGTWPAVAPVCEWLGLNISLSETRRTSNASGRKSVPYNGPPQTIHTHTHTHDIRKYKQQAMQPPTHTHTHTHTHTRVCLVFGEPALIQTLFKYKLRYKAWSMGLRLSRLLQKKNILLLK